jgi:hypothetical protein
MGGESPKPASARTGGRISALRLAAAPGIAANAYAMSNRFRSQQANSLAADRSCGFRIGLERAAAAEA